ncbi:hypothetical protein CBS101457_000225 [Exobasidium rhododendri]|nr:hypothetical protein CBS101457_000225 [Exobasidium rhododendri]
MNSGGWNLGNFDSGLHLPSVRTRDASGNPPTQYEAQTARLSQSYNNAAASGSRTSRPTAQKSGRSVAALQGSNAPSNTSFHQPQQHGFQIYDDSQNASLNNSDQHHEQGNDFGTPFPDQFLLFGGQGGGNEQVPVCYPPTFSQNLHIGHRQDQGWPTSSTTDYSSGVQSFWGASSSSSSIQRPSIHSFDDRVQYMLSQELPSYRPPLHNHQSNDLAGGATNLTRDTGLNQHLADVFGVTPVDQIDLGFRWERESALLCYGYLMTEHKRKIVRIVNRATNYEKRNIAAKLMQTLTPVLAVSLLSNIKEYVNGAVSTIYGSSHRRYSHQWMAGLSDVEAEVLVYKMHKASRQCTEDVRTFFSQKRVTMEEAAVLYHATDDYREQYADIKGLTKNDDGKRSFGAKTPKAGMQRGSSSSRD